MVGYIAMHNSIKQPIHTYLKTKTIAPLKNMKWARTQVNSTLHSSIKVPNKSLLEIIIRNCNCEALTFTAKMPWYS